MAVPSLCNCVRICPVTLDPLGWGSAQRPPPHTTCFLFGETMKSCQQTSHGDIDRESKVLRQIYPGLGEGGVRGSSD